MATLARSRTNTGAALIFLLGAAVFLNYVDRGAIAVAAPLMKGELGLSRDHVRDRVSAFFWVYAPVQLVIGWLCGPLLGLQIGWPAGSSVGGEHISDWAPGGFMSLLVLRIMLASRSIAFPGSSRSSPAMFRPERRGLDQCCVAAVWRLAGRRHARRRAIVAQWAGAPMFFVFGVATLLSGSCRGSRRVRALPTSGHQ